MTGSNARGPEEERPVVSAEGDLSGRLERLGAELEARRPAPQPVSAGGAASSDPTALARALRASTEFVAGIVVGCGIGWVLDRGLGTSPWGLIVFLLLGFVAGVYNVLRSAGLPAPTGRRDGADGPGR